jgi:PAS domain S-box-containing protein
MKILVIDDNPDDRVLAIRELRKGFPDAHILEIANLETFEAELERGDFDVVFTDYQMGWANGLEILRRVKARFPSVPVLMLTGTGGEQVAVAALKEGADDYILKSQTRFDRLPRAMMAALERARQRAELLEAERRYGELFRSVPVGLSRCAPDGRILEANPALATLLGLAEGALEGLRLPELIEGTERTWEAALSGQAQEVRLRRPDGKLVWAVLRARILTTRTGPVAECAVTDITESKRADNERKALVGELYHRVNNTLQVLIAMVTAQATRFDEPAVRSMLSDLAARIQAISLIQQRLYESGTFAEVELGDFLRDLASSLVGSATRTRLELSPLRVPVNQAIPLGLAANELITNSIKHAFSGREPGEILVRLSVGDNQAVLEISDSGIGQPPKAARRDGYGTHLLQTLVRQARAEMTVESEAGRGTRTLIRFPIESHH